MPGLGPEGQAGSQRFLGGRSATWWKIKGPGRKRGCLGKGEKTWQTQGGALSGVSWGRELGEGAGKWAGIRSVGNGNTSPCYGGRSLVGR